MNDRMIERQGGKPEFGAQKRDDLHLRRQAVGVSQRNVRSRFLAVHRDVADLDLQTERNDMEAADIGAPAGHAVDFLDHAASDVGLEGIGGGVPEACEDRDEQNGGS